jgi:hypothetical protein
MEFYDSKNKSDLHQFYLHKSTHLLTNPNVISILDKEGIEKFNSEKSSINLFQENHYKIVLSPDPQDKRRRSSSQIPTTNKRNSKRIIKQISNSDKRKHSVI